MLHLTRHSNNQIHVLHSHNSLWILQIFQIQVGIHRAWHECHQVLSNILKSHILNMTLQFCLDRDFFDTALQSVCDIPCISFSHFSTILCYSIKFTGNKLIPIPHQNDPLGLHQKVSVVRNIMTQRHGSIHHFTVHKTVKITLLEIPCYGHASQSHMHITCHHWFFSVTFSDQ